MTRSSDPVIDYASQDMAMGDLLRSRGVSLSEDERRRVVDGIEARLSRTDSEVQIFSMGDWTLKIQGIDELVNLLEALRADHGR